MLRRQLLHRGSWRHSSGELLEAKRVLATLVISEINYDPYAQIAAFGDSSPTASDYEFVEIQNVGTQPANLDGVSFVQTPVNGVLEGISFTFPATSLPPGARVVVARNVQAFQSRYGAVSNLAGAWQGGGLSNQGETLTLTDGGGATIFQVAYDSNSDWPTRANGIGASLELKDPTLLPNDPNNWRSSVEYGGTPGRAPGDRTTRVIINEVLAHTDPPLKDAVELKNLTDAPLDVTGWYFSDRIGNPFNFRMGRNSIIPPNGYLVITSDDFSPGGGTLPNDIGLSERGDNLLLISANTAGRPLNIEDYMVLSPTANAVSVGSVLEVRDASEPLPLAELSFGRANGVHRQSDVVISEVQYHPSDDDNFKEFIELRNASGRNLLLDGWALDDAVQFAVPVATPLAAGEAVVIVPFDPANVARATAFRDFYEINASVRLLGPWSANTQGVPNTLSNSSETVTLRSPLDDIDVVVYPAVDRVEYSDNPDEGWSVVADGSGGSLSRTSNTAFGNTAASWTATRPSPGDRSPSFTNAPLLTLGSPTSGDVGTDGAIVRGAGDVDVYRLRTASAGNYTITVGPSGSTVDPVVRLFSVDGTEVAFSNLQDAITTATLTANLSASTDYLVVVSGDSVLSNPRSYNPLTGAGLIAGSTGAYQVSVQSSTVVLKPWQNSTNSLDVNNDTQVSPVDALLVINQLNGAGSLPPAPATPPPYLDVNGDNQLSPVDALLVINFLNQPRAAVAISGLTERSAGEIEDLVFHDASHADFTWAAALLSTLDDESPLEEAVAA